MHPISILDKWLGRVIVTLAAVTCCARIQLEGFQSAILKSAVLNVVVAWGDRDFEFGLVLRSNSRGRCHVALLPRRTKKLLSKYNGGDVTSTFTYCKAFCSREGNCVVSVGGEARPGIWDERGSVAVNGALCKGKRVVAHCKKGKGGQQTSHKSKIK